MMLIAVAWPIGETEDEGTGEIAGIRRLVGEADDHHQTITESASP